MGRKSGPKLLGTRDQGLHGVRWRNRHTGADEQHQIAHLFVFTGADPAASWLTGSGILLHEKGFIRTGADVRSTDRAPLPLETGVEGIFAVGHVRCGSVKRVGAAIGGGGRGRGAAAHVPRPAWFYAGQRDAREGTPIRHSLRLGCTQLSLNPPVTNSPPADSDRA